MNRSTREKILLGALFIIVYLLPLGARDLMVPDETRYAEIPREMIASGDWVVPHLNGARYFEKPALGYWVHAAALLIGGETNFAVRLPSALAVGVAALLIFSLVARSGDRDAPPGRKATPALAVIVFLTCFEVFGVGSTAVLDNLFALFLTAAVVAFYAATLKPAGSAGERCWLVLAGAAAGLAFLTKGFLGIVLPALVLVPYLAWQGRGRDIWRMGWLPVLAALLVALPWSVAIGLREPDFWRFFIWNEHIRRFAGAAAQHREPPWYFLTIAPAMFLPWTFLVPAAVKGLRASSQEGARLRHLVRFCLCWLVLPFVFFSVSKGKLLTYILPCFPPFAVLMAVGLGLAVERGSQRPVQWGIAGTGILFAAVLVAFVGIQSFGYQGMRPFSHAWQALMVVNGLSFMILLCFLAFKSPMNVKKITLFGLSPLLLFFIGHFTLPDQTLVAKAPGRFIERHRSDIGPDAVVISDEDTVRAGCWYLKRSDLYVVDGAGELDYGMAYTDAGSRVIPLNALVQRIRRNQGDVVLIARSAHLAQWKARLPAPVVVGSNGADGYAIWKFHRPLSIGWTSNR